MSDIVDPAWQVRVDPPSANLAVKYIDIQHAVLMPAPSADEHTVAVLMPVLENIVDIDVGDELIADDISKAEMPTRFVPIEVEDKIEPKRPAPATIEGPPAKKAASCIEGPPAKTATSSIGIVHALTRGCPAKAKSKL